MIAAAAVVFALAFVAAIWVAIARVWKESAAEVAAERPAKIAAIKAELLTAEAERIIALENEVKRIRGAK